MSFALTLFPTTSIHSCRAKKCLDMNMVFFLNRSSREKAMCEPFSCKIAHLIREVICKGMHIRCNILGSIKPLQGVYFFLCFRKGLNQVGNPLACVLFKFVDFSRCHWAWRTNQLVESVKFIPKKMDSCSLLFRKK